MVILPSDLYMEMTYEKIWHSFRPNPPSSMLVSASLENPLVEMVNRLRAYLYSYIRQFPEKSFYLFFDTDASFAVHSKLAFFTAEELLLPVKGESLDIDLATLFACGDDAVFYKSLKG